MKKITALILSVLMLLSLASVCTAADAAIKVYKRETKELVGEYSGFSEALEACTDTSIGYIIELQRDVTDSSATKIWNDTTGTGVRVSDYVTIKSKDGSHFKLTLINNAADGNVYGACLEVSGSNIILENVTLTNKKDDKTVAGYCAIRVISGNSVTLHGGAVIEGGFTSSPIMMDVPNVTVNLEGGTINASKWMKVQNGGTLNLKSGVIDGTGCADAGIIRVLSDNGGTVNLTGGTIKNGGANVSGVYAEKGTVEIGATTFENVAGPEVLALDGGTVNNTAKKATDKSLLSGATAYGDKTKLDALKKSGFKVPEEVAQAAAAPATTTTKTESTTTGVKAAGKGEIDTTGNMVVTSVDSIDADGNVAKNIKTIDLLTDGQLSGASETGITNNKSTFVRADWSIDTEKGQFLRIKLSILEPVEFSGIRIYTRKADASTSYDKSCASKLAMFDIYDEKGNHAKTGKFLSTPVVPGGDVKGTQYVDYTLMADGKVYSVTNAAQIVIDVYSVYGDHHWGSEEIKLTLDEELKPEKKTVRELKSVKFKDDEVPEDGAAGKQEVKVNAADSPYVDKTGWKAVVEKDTITSYNEDGTVKSSFRNGQRVIDGNENSYWHSGYDVIGGHPANKQEAPYDIDITFDKKTAISGISFLPRQDNNLTGVPTSVEYFFLIDGEYKVLGTYGYTANSLRKTESFTSNIEVDGLRMRVHVGAGGYGSCAEVDVLKANKDYATVTYDEFFENEAKGRLYPLDKEQVYMTAACNYEGVWDTHTLDKMFDGKDNLFWQSAFYSEGFTIEVTVDLHSFEELSAIGYLPRQDDDDGFWYKYTVYASEDGEAFEKVARVENEKHSYDEQIVTLEKPVTARYIKFAIDKGDGSCGSCAELNFYQSYEQYKEKSKGQSFKLVIGSNEIETEEGKVALDVAPYIENGTTFVPLRGLLELMGAEIEWNGENQSITIKKDSTEIFLQIRNALVDVTTLKWGKVRYTLLADPRITDSRTFIPIRFVSEHLGYNVSWDGETGTVTIEK